MSPKNPDPPPPEETPAAEETPSLPVTTWAEVAPVKFNYAPEVVTAAMAHANIPVDQEVTESEIEAALETYLNAPAYGE